MQKNNTNNQKSNESFFEILFKTLSRIGTVLIIAFGILFFGLKKVFTSFNKKGDNETFSSFVKRLEDQLNASASQHELRRKIKADIKPKNEIPKYKSHKKPATASPYSAKTPQNTVTVKNKYKPKKSAAIKLLQSAAALVVIVGVIVVVVVAVKNIFSNKADLKDFVFSKDAAEKTEPISASESFKYYNDLYEMQFNAKTKDFLSEINPIEKNEPPASEASIFCGDEPIVSTDVNEMTTLGADTTIEASPAVSPSPMIQTTPVPQVTMDTANAVFGKDILIHKGDSLDEVAMIQERLMDLHYMDADEPTTLYGEMTFYAMQLFQRGHGLMVDGVAGYETLTLLFSDEAKQYLVRKGDYGFDIYTIKKRLIELGYLDDDNTSKKLDEDTDYAIRVFQGRNKLSQDGIVGYNTTQVLFNGDAKPASNYKPPSSGSGGSSSSGGSGGSSASYDANSAADFVKYAKSCMNKGYTYVWGGKAPPGMDCSGFVYHSLNATGNGIGYMTSAAWAKSSYTTISSMSDVKPGDILCFQGHVAIAIGDGKMIDSSSSSNTIRIANFESSSYWNRKWICAKRYFD